MFRPFIQTEVGDEIFYIGENILKNILKRRELDSIFTKSLTNTKKDTLDSGTNGKSSGINDGLNDSINDWLQDTSFSLEVDFENKYNN